MGLVESLGNCSRGGNYGTDWHCDMDYLGDAMRFTWFDYLRLVWDTLTTSRYEKHLLTVLRRLEMEKSELKEENAKLKLAVFPLASPAGAEYVRRVSPPAAPAGGTGAGSVKSWAAMQAEHIMELEKSEEINDGHGVRTEKVQV